MKTFAIDEDLINVLERIGKRFNHEDINKTIFCGFTFLRFLEDVQKEEASLFLQDKEGKTVKLPIEELMNLKFKEENKVNNKNKSKVLR